MTLPLMDVGLVCDACDGFSELGAQTCSKCGASLSLGSRSSQQPAAPAPAAAEPPQTGHPCSRCGEMIAPGHGFCGRCGAPVATAPPAAETSEPRKANTMFFGAMQQARAKLVRIKGDGLDGVSFTLAGPEDVAGRVDAQLLVDADPFPSPTPATFV